MFNISILSYSTMGGTGLGKILLQDQHKVDGHLVYSAENPQMANTTHSLGSVCVLTNTAAAGSSNQSGRPAEQHNGPRPN